MTSTLRGFLLRRLLRALVLTIVVSSAALTLVHLAPGDAFSDFTTDPAAALRAMEMRADVILKGTKVDGIYTADPMVDKTATKYQEISYLKVLEQGLKVMDATAISLCGSGIMRP